MNKSDKIRMFLDKAHMGDAVSQSWLDSAANELRSDYFKADSEEEMLFLLDGKGELNGLKAPRWLCHLIGLRHGTVHVVLWSANSKPRMLFQVRSKMKKEFPNHLELSVTGHCGTERDWVSAAYKEMHEEIGIRAEDLRGKLIYVGVNFQVFDDNERNFHDRECARIYTQRLRISGIASLYPNKDEVEKLLFINENAIGNILNKWKTAPGLNATLPIYMKWLSKNKSLIFEA